MNWFDPIYKDVENPMVMDCYWPPERIPFLFCNHCKGEIYEGEEFYTTNGLIKRYDTLCEECWDEVVLPIVKEDFVQLAERYPPAAA